MLAALLALLEAVVDESPAILDSLEQFTARKRQQYPSVRAAVDDETSSNLSALQKSEAKP